MKEDAAARSQGWAFLLGCALCAAFTTTAILRNQTLLHQIGLNRALDAGRRLEARRDELAANVRVLAAPARLDTQPGQGTE